MKVLIAEDDRVSREILVRALEKAHHSIQIVADGSAALAAMQEADGPLIARLGTLDRMGRRGLCAPYSGFDQVTRIKAALPFIYTPW